MDYLDVCGLSVQEFGDISVIVLLLIFSLSSQNINRIIKIILHLLRYVLWPTLWCFPEKAMAPHSSALAWKIPWMEEPGRLQSMGSQRTERLHFHFSLSCTGEGNGNPLQCSCLENPRDRGAWWAAIYGVS